MKMMSGKNDIKVIHYTKVLKLLEGILLTSKLYSLLFKKHLLDVILVGLGKSDL